MTDRVELPFTASEDLPAINPDAEVEEEIQEVNGDVVDDKQQEERPEWLPEKFKSPEDLAQAYKELEQKQGKPKEVEDTPDESDATEDTQDEQLDAAEEAVEKAGLNMQEIEEYYQENQELSPEHYEALEKSGIPSAKVDLYLQGIQALAENKLNTLMDSVGGKDTYQDMVEWASQNLTKEEAKAFNKVTDNYYTDTESAKLAVEGLYNRYSNAVGTDPSMIRGSGNGADGSTFRSVGEMEASMDDPRYDSDTYYRQQIEQKAIRSKLM